MLRKTVFFKYVFWNKLRLHYSQKFTSCFTENTVRLHYKDRSVNVVEGNKWLWEFIFWERRCWKFMFSGTWLCVVERVVTDVWKDRGTFETSASTRRKTQRHIPGNLNLQRWNCPFAHFEGTWRSRVVAPFILNLRVRRRWVISFTFRPLCHRGKNARYQLKSLG